MVWLSHNRLINNKKIPFTVLNSQLLSSYLQFNFVSLGFLPKTSGCYIKHKTARMSFSFYDADMLNRLKDQNNGTSGLVSKLCQNKFCLCVDIAYFVHNQINYLSVGLLLLFVTFEKELKIFFV
jgi:hypothetical protein